MGWEVWGTPPTICVFFVCLSVSYGFPIKSYSGVYREPQVGGFKDPQMGFPKNLLVIFLKPLITVCYR